MNENMKIETTLEKLMNGEPIDGRFLRKVKDALEKYLLELPNTGSVFLGKTATTYTQLSEYFGVLNSYDEAPPTQIGEFSFERWDNSVKKYNVFVDWSLEPSQIVVLPDLEISSLITPTFDKLAKIFVKVPSDTRITHITYDQLKSIGDTKDDYKLPFNKKLICEMLIFNKQVDSISNEDLDKMFQLLVM